MIHIHETNLLCVHHILKKKDFNLTLNSFFGNFKIYNFIKENFSEKFSYLYLMKIQICFVTRKIQICI